MDDEPTVDSIAVHYFLNGLIDLLVKKKLLSDADVKKLVSDVADDMLGTADEIGTEKPENAVKLRQASALLPGIFSRS